MKPTTKIKEIKAWAIVDSLGMIWEAYGDKADAVKGIRFEDETIIPVLITPLKPKKKTK